MMRFGSATFSILALVVIKTKKKLEKAKLEKFPDFAVKKCSKPFLVSRVLSSNSSASLKKFAGQ